jgi:hypothetical protein
MKKISILVIAFLLISITNITNVYAGGCAPPSNEQCAGANPIAIGGCSAGQGGCDVTGDPGGVSCGPAMGGSVWYSFVAPASGNVDVTMTLTGGYYSPIVLYSGACGAQAEVGCYYPAPLANPYTGSFTGLTPGATYYVMIASPVPGGPTPATTWSSLCVVDAGGSPCPDCSNGIMDCSETGVDCGGPDCAPCGGGPDCLNGQDCGSPQTLVLNASGGGAACVVDCNTGATGGPVFVGPPICSDMPNETVWFSITTDGTAATLDIDLTSGTMSSTPEFTLFANNCGPYTIHDCVEGSGGSASSTGIPVSTNTTYLIAVSNVSGSTGTFNLCVAQIPDNSACNTNHTFVMASSSFGSPQGGPYVAGEVVEFCYSVTDFQQINCNYIGAFVPEFGDCWDPASFDAQGQPVNITTSLNVNGTIQPCPPGPPCPWNACAGQPSGSWNWFPAGTATYNVPGYYSVGDPMPAGWYFLSNYDPITGNCTPTPTDPDNTYGDGDFPNCGTNTFDYDICFTLIAGSDPNFTNCMVGMKTFADAEFGAWGDIGCTVDLLDVIAGVLPVKLISFTAEVEDNTFVKLNWITESEINNNYYTVERSKDGEIFESIGTVDGAGNSNSTIEYTMLDNNPYIGTSYYRLKQTDFDGKFEYLGVVAVKIKSAFEDLTIFPNPVEGIGYLTFNASVTSNFIVEIYDVAGKKVVSENYTTAKGSNTFTLNTEALSQGMYFLNLNNGVESTTVKFVKD